MPLHRSILFWLGLFVLSFLLWAWADSRRYDSSWVHHMAYAPGEDYRRYHITHFRSAISIGDLLSYASPADGLTSLASPATDYRRRRRKAPTESEWFPAAGFFLKINPGTGGAVAPRNGRPVLLAAQRERVLQIPHWLIVLAYLVSFTALLLYRARRRRQLLPTTPPPRRRRRPIDDWEIGDS